MSISSVTVPWFLTLVGALLEVITLHYSTTIVSVVNVLPLLSTYLCPMQNHCYGDENFMAQYLPNYKTVP